MNTTDICIRCGSKCCRSTPPALTKNDIIQIEKQIQGTDWLMEIKENEFVVAKKPNSKNCFFLDERGLCLIYEFRPIDCKLFPFFVKIRELTTGNYLIEWRIWFCPLTDHVGLEELYKNARKIVLGILNHNPTILFEYQRVLYSSGGYKRKHFWKKEIITIKETNGDKYDISSHSHVKQ
ncbi:MAG: YkgJ family cysteine cluster protein [Candidatus Heimdallarchaeaceae archaeon]